MDIFAEIMKLSTPENVISREETFEEYRIELMSVFDENNFKSSIDNFMRMYEEYSSDEFFLTLTPIVRESKAAGNNTILKRDTDLEELEDFFNYQYNQEEDDLRLTVRIVKSIYKNAIGEDYMYIYEPLIFFKQLMSHDLKVQWSILNTYVQKVRIFQIPECVDEFETTLLRFCHDAKNQSKQDDYKVKASNIETNFINRGSLEYLNPAVFYLEKNSGIDDINSYFRKCTLIFSLVDICNFSSIDDDGFLVVYLDGYKKIEYKGKLRDITESSFEIMYNIHSWIYRSDEVNISEKLGLVRNVLSISLVDDNILEIFPTALASIKSNYKIYLKENVTNYISVKNSITESIYSLSKDVHDITNQLASNFRLYFISILSFYISVIIINSASGNGLSGIFTNDILNLTILFAIGSSFGLWQSLRSSERSFERVEKLYERLKDQYIHLLSEQEIKQIFDDANCIKEDRTYYEAERKATMVIWIILVIVLVILALCSAGYIGVGCGRWTWLFKQT